MDEEEKRMASSGRNPSLLEPKEEPLDDFLLMAGGNETVTQSTAIMKKEVKEEPVDLVDSFPVKNEISNLVPISSAPVKKEPDQYIQDLVGLGLIPAWDLALDQSARYGITPVFVEASIEKVKEEVDSSIEQPLELADEIEPATKKSRPNSKNGIMQSLDLSDGTNTSAKLPVESKSKEEDGSVVAEEVNRQSDERELQSKSVMKNLILMKNDTELECPEPECKFRSRFVRVWIRHLKKKHSTTLIQAGLILRCKCGNASQTGAHILECNSTNDCVVRVARKITGDLKCPECEFRTKSTSSWVEHLKSEHSTTPLLAGFALLCECGHVSFSDNHRIKCPIANFSIVRKSDGPIRRLDDDVTTPQCILCEAHPRTAHKYAAHLRIDHESTLQKNNIAIKCACGVEVRNESAFTHGQHHNNKCDGYEFTVHKVDRTTPQCVLCDLYPRTPQAYACHIQEAHKSTMIREKIYLICSCGTKLTSVRSSQNHRNECDDLEFSLHKIEGEIHHSTPQCILCEAFPSTAYAYPDHLRKIHKSTLIAEGIFIRCACGLEVRSVHRDSSHSKKCNGREFTLHKMDERATEVRAVRLSTSKDVPSTPKCILCEAYPSTTNAYPEHLKARHKSTLAANGMYIRCACGLKIRSRNWDPSHGKKCDGRKFTLHKLNEEVTEPTAAHLSTSEEEMRTVSNESLLEPKEEPMEYSMSVENEISQPLFMGVDNCKKEELVDDEEVSNLPPPSSPVKDEPIVDEYVQGDLVRFGQQ